MNLHCVLGLSVNYGCSNGNCGFCKATLISGEISRTRHYDHVIPAAEKQAGAFLLCAHTAESDLVIEVNESSDSHDISEQNITAKVKKLAQLNDSY